MKISIMTDSILNTFIQMYIFVFNILKNQHGLKMNGSDNPNLKLLDIIQHK